MILKSANFNKFTLVIAVSFLVASCSQLTINSSSERETSKLVAKANSIYCTAGVENTTLNLTDVKLKRAQNIPLMYQGFNNIEGPVWHDGALYYSNMGSRISVETGLELTNQSTIWRWVPGESPTVWLDDTVAGTNGLAIDSKGNLMVGRQLDGSISFIDWQSKKVTPIVASYKNKRFNSPNDLTIGFDDTIYFTDPNWNTPSNINVNDIQGGGDPGSTTPGQRIYRVSPNGDVTATLATTLVPALGDKPNGIMLSLDQTQLVIGGLQGLWVFDLNSGRLSVPKQLLTTPIDGLGKDCSGNIYVTTTRELTQRNDGQVVVVLDKNYQEVGQINVPGIHIVTNVAFGGDDGKTLFVTGLTAPMDGGKPRQCGDATCLAAGIYTAKLNVQGFGY